MEKPACEIAIQKGWIIGLLIAALCVSFPIHSISTANKLRISHLADAGFLSTCYIGDRYEKDSRPGADNLALSVSCRANKKDRYERISKGKEYAAEAAGSVAQH
jgi:hypothetical protein